MRTPRRFLCLWLVSLLYALMLMPTAAWAKASISTSQTASFSRVSFAWPAPTQMQMQANGNTVTLRFAQPIGADAGAIASRLRPYVKGVTRNPDGRSLTLSLAAPYRVRQFVSGNTTGIDILTQTTKPAIPPLASPKPDTPIPVAPMPKIAPPAPRTAPTPKVSEPPKPSEAPTAPAQPALVKPEANPVAPTPIKPLVAVANPMLTAKEPETEKAPAPAAAPEPIAPDPILTTKPTATTPKAQEQPLVAPSVTAAAAMLTTKTEETAPSSPKEEVSPPAEVAPPPQAAAQQSSEKADAFAVRIQKEVETTRFIFPFTERTALAVFRDNQEIWAVFDREFPISLAQFREALPKGITDVSAFQAKGYRALRFTAAPEVALAAIRNEKSFVWELRSAPATPEPELNSEWEIISEPQGKAMLLKIFDTAEPLRFVNPRTDMHMIVVPAYEAERGMRTALRTSAFSIPASQQGIAIIAQDDSVRATKTRAGLRLRSTAGLPISEKLPLLPGQQMQARVSEAAKKLVLANNKFFLPGDELREVRARLMLQLAGASDAERPAILKNLAGMYLSQGYGPEAQSILNELLSIAPHYYAKEKLAIMHTAAAFLAGRLGDAGALIQHSSLADNEEARMWREAIGLFVPLKPVPKAPEKLAEEMATYETALAAAKTAQPAADQGATVTPAAPVKPSAFTYETFTVFNFLAYQKTILQYYAPRLRQKLAIIAADAYIQAGQYDAAMASFDTLDADGILTPIMPYAEYLFGKVAAEKGKPKHAMKLWKRLTKGSDAYIRARAGYSMAMLDYSTGNASLVDTITRLNALRVEWRGDGLERELLNELATLYIENAQYDEALRVWKELLNAFPADPESLKISTEMAQLFLDLYQHGKEKEMEPLKSLALFYEFRDLTPVGEAGDTIIQNLADRLAGVDLLARAIELLDHQIKFRVTGEDRARVGARLALLYLMNQQPEKALETLEGTNYGNLKEALRLKRLQLTAQTLAAMDRTTEALEVLTQDQSDEAQMLRLGMVWELRDWPNVINQAENMLAMREDLTKPLSPREQDILMKLALAYNFERDGEQLRYLRDYYLALIPEDSTIRGAFDYLTNDTNPLDAEDVKLLTEQIDRTENFLKGLSAKVSEGKLSEAVP